MRSMFARFPGDRGFTTKDVEQLASQVCGRNLKWFFDAYARGGRPMDFNRHLALAGLTMEVEWKAAERPDGLPLPDYQMEAWSFQDRPGLRFWLVNPDSAWSRAGLHTDDQLLRFNGTPIEIGEEFAELLKALRIGDTTSLEVLRAGKVRMATIAIGSFVSPVVKIRELPDRTERQKASFERWNAGQ